MFDAISKRYDLTNDVLTLGIDRLWKRAMIRAVSPAASEHVLDLAAGTGTSSAALAKHALHVTAADFSEGMLEVGRRRHRAVRNLEFVWADATSLHFPDDTFDAVTISYGLRNVQDTEKALREMVRVTKPGGRVVICEFSTPCRRLRAPYRFYSRHVLPRIAAILGGSRDAYEYLNESIEAWPNQNQLAHMMREAGLEQVKYRNLTGGIAALHKGYVPECGGASGAAFTVACASDAESAPAFATKSHPETVGVLAPNTETVAAPAGEGTAASAPAPAPQSESSSAPASQSEPAPTPASQSEPTSNPALQSESTPNIASKSTSTPPSTPTSKPAPASAPKAAHSPKKSQPRRGRK